MKVMLNFEGKKEVSMTTLAINNLWNYINGLALTSSEATWLSEKLMTKANEISKADKSETKSNQQIIHEKFKDLKISPSIRKFRGCVKLSTEDMKDERTKYILNK